MADPVVGGQQQGAQESAPTEPAPVEGPAAPPTGGEGPEVEVSVQDPPQPVVGATGEGPAAPPTGGEGPEVPAQDPPQGPVVFAEGGGNTIYKAFVWICGPDVPKNGSLSWRISHCAFIVLVFLYHVGTLVYSVMLNHEGKTAKPLVYIAIAAIGGVVSILRSFCAIGIGTRVVTILNAACLGFATAFDTASVICGEQKHAKLYSVLSIGALVGALLSFFGEFIIEFHNLANILSGNEAAANEDGANNDQV